jgi:hypothetical protein
MKILFHERSLQTHSIVRLLKLGSAKELQRTTRFLVYGKRLIRRKNKIVRGLN